jgi:NAD(P)-dependent dehydrogenase (short-subunit alcohol dehydrogenase family)
VAWSGEESQPALTTKERLSMAIKLKSLADQVLVITGATSGNGLAIARQAVRQGAAVVLAARNGDALRSVQSELAAQGGRAAMCIADVSEQEAVERIAHTALEAFGGFDSWINNAAAATYGTLEQVSVADHRRVFDVGYFGYLYGSLAAARHLRSRGGGAIINIGSVLGDRAIVQQGPYCATKHAVQALTDTLRMELERDGANISVTLIKPGPIDTLFPEHARNYMDQPPRLPPPLYHPDVVADAVLFACTTPRRQLYVGGAGLLSSIVGQMAPRLTDLVMEAVGKPMQEKPGDPGRPARRDNLYEPREDGALRGSQSVYARRSSLALQAQKHRAATAALALGIGTAIASLGVLRRLGGTSRPKRRG